MIPIFTISYSCPDVGEFWNVDGVYFFSVEDAETYIREHLVDERSGRGCYFEDFSIDEKELWLPESMEFELRNKHMRDQKEHTKLPLVEKIETKNNIDLLLNIRELGKVSGRD